MTLSGDITDSAEIDFSFEAQASGTFSLRLGLSTQFTVDGSDPLEVTASADSGQTVAVGWTVSGSADGCHVISVGMSAAIPSDSLGLYERYDEYPYYIEISSGFTTFSEPDSIPPTFALDDSVITYGPGGTAMTIDVNVAGRVGYLPIIGPCFSADGVRGVPGVDVYLDWDENSDPARRTLQPGQPASVKTDDNGIFAFSFTFPSDVPANQIASNLRVWVGTGNAAVPRPFKYQYFVDHGVIDISEATTVVDAGVDISVEVQRGSALRYLHRARKFYRDAMGDEYLDTIHVTFGKVSTSRFIYVPGVQGPRIDFAAAPSSETAYHEYGHYVDHSHGGIIITLFPPDHYFTKVTSPDVAWKEGWAEYFSAVCNEYWHAREPQFGIEDPDPLSLSDQTDTYQFLDHLAHRKLRDALATIDPSQRHTVEGVIASILYSCHDSYLPRANGYFGDNDDVTISGRWILYYVTQAENSEDERYNDLLDGLFAKAGTGGQNSVWAIWNYYMNGVGLPHSAPPADLELSLGPGGIEMNWVDNSWPTGLSVVSGHCPTYVPLNYRPNRPSNFRVYRQFTDQEWMAGSLDGYDLVANVPYPTVSWNDTESIDGPVSYVVVAENTGGQSRPAAETGLVPPAYFDTPETGSEVADILHLVASVKPQSEIRGFPITSSFSSFDVEWGGGTSPGIWSANGISYSIDQSATADHDEIATWNTGVVPSGTYTVRLVAHYGAEQYETRRVVDVQHRSAVVDGSWGGYTSIQEAMNNWAQMGDTILVTPGTYVGNLVLKPTVQLVAEGGVPVIEGVGNGSVITANDHDYPATIDGFEIRRQLPVTEFGAHGLMLVNSPVVIRNCRFTNLQGVEGAAILASGESHVLLENCAFDNVVHYGYAAGSVIYLWGGDKKPSIKVYDCVFESNEAAICDIRYDASDPLQGLEPQSWFQRCTFKNNTIFDHVVSIWYSDRTAVFRDCVFVDNTVTPSFAAFMGVIYCNDAKILLDGCTFARNLPCEVCEGWVVGAVSAGGYGPKPVTMEDCIVAFNGGPAVYRSDGSVPSDVAMSRSVVYGNTPYASAPTDAAWAVSGQDVYNMNPAFCDTAAGDYSLYAFSPAAPGPYFAERAGALDVGCVPDAVVTGQPSNFPFGSGDDRIIAACPAGDGPAARVLIDLDDAALTRDIAAGELTLNVQDFTSKVFDADGVLPADSACVLTSGFATTIQHGTLGFYGVDSVQVMLNGWPLAAKARLDIRTPDAAEPFGVVNVSDVSYFGLSMPPNPYRKQSDFNGDGSVTLSDFAHVGLHYDHQTALPAANAVTGVAQSSAEVVLGFTGEFLTATHQRLYVDVSLDGIAGVTTCVFSMRKVDETLTFVEWQPAGSDIGQTLFAPTVRDGSPELFFGVLVSESFAGTGAHLGRLVFDVAQTTPYEVTDSDFVLTVGDVLLEAGGGLTVAAEMSGVISRRLDTDVARIYHNRLEQNFPNPFNPATTVAFSLQAGANVSLTIYDVAGRRVRELLNEKRNAGAYRVDWDGHNDRGQPIASGVYFYKLVAGSFTDTKKMTILK